MQNRDAVHVFDKGKANLDFHYGLTFTLYNDTVAGGTSIDTEGTARQAVLKLSQGGLKGHNPPGSETTVKLPNGVNILILGTQYFITYDPWQIKYGSLTSMGLCNINFPMGIISRCLPELCWKSPMGRSLICIRICHSPLMTSTATQQC